MLRKSSSVAIAAGLAFVLALASSAVHAAGSAPSGVFLISPTGTPPPTPVPVGPKNSPSPSPYPTALATPTPAPSPPSVSAAAAILVDMRTGQILYAKRPGERRPVASLTKLMTALIVISRGHLGATVTVSPRAAAEPGSSLDLKPGEEITVRNLLYGMLLASANDAAMALAEHVSGAPEKFVRLMNRRARALGMHATRFASPEGLNDSGHSTARDLAILTRAAYHKGLFGRVVSTKTVDIPAPTGDTRHIQNRNALLWLDPWAVGVKTGYTEKAGFCMVSTGKRGHRLLVAVVLGSRTQFLSFNDAATLLNFGLLEFRRRILVLAGQFLGHVVIEGRPVPVRAAETADPLVRADLVDGVKVRLVADPLVSLPLASGAPVGRALFVSRRHVVASIPIASTTPVAAPPIAPAEARTWVSGFEDVGDLLGGVARGSLGTFL